MLSCGVGVGVCLPTSSIRSGSKEPMPELPEAQPRRWRCLSFETQPGTKEKKPEPCAPGPHPHFSCDVKDQERVNLWGNYFSGKTQGAARCIGSSKGCESRVRVLGARPPAAGTERLFISLIPNSQSRAPSVGSGVDVRHKCCHPLLEP